MRRLNWIKNKVGAILALTILVAITGCGGSGSTGGASSSSGGSGGSGVTTKSATINWSSSTTNIDGSPLTELAGYRVYYGTQSGNYTATVNVADPAATGTLVTGLQQNTTYYFAVTAYDASGNESAYSNEGIKAL